MKDVIQEAKELAELAHAGQKRKEGIPYITHPRGVVGILEKLWPLPNPPEDVETILSVAWLHDVLEDTPMTYDYLRIRFGKSIADKVYLLSRNVDREEYKTRIKKSDYIVKLVKLADTLHNVNDPYSLAYLPARSIRRKIDDCRAFYIPLAREICPSIGYRLKESIDNYLKISGGKK